MSAELRKEFKVYGDISRVLDDPNTKRMLLDSRQAAVFSELDESPPEYVQSKLRLPFEQFYVELTEPICIGTPETGHVDHLRAVMLYRAAAKTSDGAPLHMLVFFFEDSLGRFVDREFPVCIARGEALVTKGTAMDPACWSGRYKAESAAVSSTLPDSLDHSDWFVAGQLFPDMPIRTIGWWEIVAQEYLAFFSWFLSYTMSKSVRIVMQHPSPAGRCKKGKRRPARMPVPWHVVTVEPKFCRAGHGPEGEPSTRHTYRYDVIGHLRFGRHKRRDGTYSETIEWVSPHQRGLSNALYIPKTYSVKRGKVESERMREYFSGV